MSKTTKNIEEELFKRPPLVPMDRKDSIPLSFAQQRLWFIDQLLPNLILYNIPFALILKGPLNTVALEQALNTLIDRHESLRTILTSKEGEASQVILPHLKINIKDCSVDLRDIKKEEQEPLINIIVQEEANTPFNLSKGPLIRAKLLTTSSKDHVFLLTLHHIISDGWSIGILFKELSELYNRYSIGEEPSLAPLPIQYADFAIWEREWLQGEVLEQQLSYWKKQLAGVPDLLDLPTDKLRPKELSYKGGSYHYTLPKDIRDKLNTLAQTEQTSLFMTVLAIFQILLYRYTGQQDIVVGSPIANRHYKEVEGIIGFFVNTLALRTTFKTGDSFKNVLKRVKETILQAYQHQDVPFEQLVYHLNINRELNRNPVFQITLTFQSASERESLELDKLTVKPFDTPYPIAKFDLSFYVSDDGEALGIGIEYATDLFESSTIERMAGHFKELIQGIVEDPAQYIETLPLLTAPEKQKILIEWNDTKTDYPEHKTIHQLFEEQVAKTPDNIAVVYEDEQLTYRELNQKANQLAHYLRTKGVGPDTLVAIAVERSLEMIIGLLGILKAGGAYVPLDPSYPQERLEFMLEDTKASILLTQSPLKDQFIDKAQQDSHIPSSQRTIVCLDEDWDLISKQPSINPTSCTLPHHLAYVIYTSGSTGVPKGVMIEHRNVIRLLKKTEQWYNFTQEDTWTLFHSYAFDFSVWEIWGALSYGGKLIIVPYLTSRSPEAFYNLLIDKKVTILNQTPSSFQQLIEHEQSLNKNQDSSIRLVIFGGEALSLHNLNSWFDRHEQDSTLLVNMYGITETTVHVTYLPIYKETLKVEGSIIGKRISDLNIYILDSYLNPAPIGVAGEIYIGGAGLARGYLNRPDLTAERFIPNPFVVARNDINGEEGKGEDSQPDATRLRLYRTGDLARYLPDGNIEFLGRIDDQVKIRGFRIELGEIESTLQNHRDVSQAIVVTREDEPGNKKLVAYVVAKDASFLTTESVLKSSAGEPFSTVTGNTLPILTEELRNHLGRILPEYMIPSFFVYIDKIPLTPNGKIDRKVLPAPDMSLRLIGDTYVAPTTEIESDLASIWSEVLKIDKIGVNDNFFRIGGDSIISIQLVAKARQQGIFFAVKDVFNHPTIGGLASVAQREATHTTADQGTVIGHVPLTPIQHWFFNNNLFEPHHFNQAVLLHPSASLYLSYLNKTLSILVGHHDALRFRYHQDTNQQWHQESIENEGDVLCSTIDLSHISVDDLPKEIEQASTLIQGSLNLETGPLVKAVLFECSNKEQRLLIVIHHLIVDGVSWRILLEDLESVYEQVMKGKDPSLPAKTHSYQQWAKALQEYSASAELRKEVPYWQQIEERTQPIPTDFDLGPVTESTTKTIEVSLTKEETTNLLQRVPKAYRTEINDILLTALLLAIGDWTKQYDLTLSLEGHGREDIIKDIDLSRTVGWFTSIFPVHLQIDTPKDIGEAIKTVKETLRHIPHKGIGYGILKYLTKQSPFNGNTHPTISFNYLGQWDNTTKEDNLLTSAKESSGDSASERNETSYLLNINGEIRDGRLQVSWSYSTNHYEESTIEHISHTFTQRLQEIIMHCCQEGVFGYTPSDFKLANLAQIMVIDNILNRNRNRNE